MVEDSGAPDGARGAPLSSLRRVRYLLHGDRGRSQNGRDCGSARSDLDEQHSDEQDEHEENR